MPRLLLLVIFLMLVCSQAVHSISIDGNDADWVPIARNSWHDPMNDAGGGSRDISNVKLDANSNTLYLFVRFGGNYGSQPYPEVSFFIDKDQDGKTGRGGYEVELVISGASSSSSCQGGCVLRRLYSSTDGSLVSETWLPQTWAPAAPNHGKDFLELALTLGGLGLTADPSFRFWIGSRQFYPGSGGDWLRWYADRAHSSLVYPRPVFAPNPTPRAVAIDGISEDWKLVSNQWTDPANDAGGGPRDIEVFKVSSDATHAYMYFQFVKAFGTGEYPEVTIYLDTDRNMATGKNGYESELIIVGANSSGNCGGGCAQLKTYNSMGATVNPGTWLSESWRPNRAGHPSRFIESRFSKSQLGIPATGLVRFYVYSRQFYPGSGGDYLQGQTSIATSSLRTTFAPVNSLDGLSDDWFAGANTWSDPDNDAGGASRDVTRMAMRHDASNLYVGINLAQAFGSNPYPELSLRFDTDLISTNGKDGYELEYVIAGASNSSPCAGGCVQRIRYTSTGSVESSSWMSSNWAPDAPNHLSSLLEVSLPWSSLGVAAGQKFRFTLRSREFFPGSGGDWLQGFSAIADSRLSYPNEVLQIGCHSHTLSADRLEEIRINLGDSSTYRKGSGFDVHLAVHGEEGSSLESGLTMVNGQIGNDYSGFLAAVERVKAKDMAYVPLINFHYLPSWFWAENQNRFDNKSANVIDAGGAVSNSSFMPALPYCDGFSQWGLGFAHGLTRTMEPYMGNTIRTLTIGNEVMFPGPASYDPAYTLPAWNAAGNNGSLPNPPTPAFFTFRSNLLMDALQSWTRTPIQASGSRLAVSTKIVPYAATDTHFPKSGYFPGIFKYLNEPANRTTAVDIYPLDSRQLQLAYRHGKTLSITEYGGGQANTETDPDSQAVAEFLIEGVLNHGVRSATMYSWTDNKGHTMKQQQKDGIKAAMRVLAKLPLPRVKDLFIRGILPDYQDNAWQVHNNTARTYSGWQYLAEETQYAEPRISFELDTKEDGFVADVTVKAVYGNINLSLEEIQERKVVYILYGTGTKATVAGHSIIVPVDKTLGPTNLVSDNYSIPVGTQVMDWTPENAYTGNRYLVTALPTNNSPISQKTLLATTDNKSVAISVGGKAVFIANEILWSGGWAGEGMERKPAATKFLSETIRKLALDQPL